MQIVIGNAIALIASILMVYVGYIKQRKKILYVQTVQMGLFVVSNLILGGIPGAIINVLSCVRNVLCYKEKLNNIAKAILIVLSAGLILWFNNLGFIGLLPLISSIAYILLMNIKDVIKFKYLIIFTCILWFIYDIYIKSYTSACFDFMCSVACVVSIIQINKKKNNQEKKGE